MRLALRRGIALAGGLILPPVLLMLALQSGWWLIGGLDLLQPPSAIAAELRLYRRFGDFYSGVSYVGVCIAGGLSFAALTWDGPRGRRGTAVVFWTLLVLVLPLSVANYWSADAYAARSKQALIDVILVFLGVVCGASLASIRTDSRAASTLKAMALFLLVMEAVCVPAVYALLWFLNAQNAVSRGTTEGFNPGWVSAVASLGALCVSVLNYRVSQRRTVEGPQLLR
jgi:hypothetical protein